MLDFGFHKALDISHLYRKAHYIWVQHQVVASGLLATIHLNNFAIPFLQYVTKVKLFELALDFGYLAFGQVDFTLSLGKVEWALLNVLDWIALVGLIRKLVVLITQSVNVAVTILNESSLPLVQRDYVICRVGTFRWGIGHRGEFFSCHLAFRSQNFFISIGWDRRQKSQLSAATTLPEHLVLQPTIRKIHFNAFVLRLDAVPLRRLVLILAKSHVTAASLQLLIRRFLGHHFHYSLVRKLLLWFLGL